MKRTFLLLFMTAAVLSTMIFIFANSLTPGDASNKASVSVAEIIQPIIEPKSIIKEQSSSDFAAFNAFVRKSAHFIEFALLGAELMALTVIITRKLFSVLTFIPLFVSLLTGVADEYLQSFITRTSAVSDIIIDFFGSISGMIFASAVFSAFMYIKRKLIQRNTTLSQLP
ncbi:MAG: VanZ family protein [Eubacteriales bacterium]